MKLSEITKEQLETLTEQELTRIVYDGISDDGSCADVALLLGTYPTYSGERAEMAAQLYLAKRVKYIIPSGGVEWEIDGQKVSEACYMEKILLERGISPDAILLENAATTTKENMIYGTLEFNRRLNIRNVRSVMIVTSAVHMRRSLALAKLYLPRSVEIVGCPAKNPCDNPENWTKDEKVSENVRRETRLMKGLVDDLLIDDIEY